ncbi:MAG: hypothetical protein IKC65_07175 [Lentisphaeria bacterium]|nr:hypothetical protein [Lentisphaeria bacterium]
MRKFILLFAAAAAVAGVVCGCTERERAGYSAIPQNSPASWEMRPFGDFRN